MSGSRGSRLAGVLLALAMAVGLSLSVLRLPTQAPTPRSVPVTAAPRGGERVVFEMADPAGDDRGPGTYRYPQDPSFLPGTFDLRRFRVSVDATAVHFRLTFGAVPNPWSAPEGFGYQRVDIYLRTGAGKGRLTPARPGANVRFAPGKGWHYLVRCAPWGGSRLEPAGVPENGADPPGREAYPVRVVARREGGDSIHLIVPRAAVGCPGKRWRYYVLVGGYDAFGPDEYRPVTAQGGRWVFGGGRDDNTDPNVLDLLAPRFSLRSQNRQLRTPPDGGLPVVYPAGGR
ncbi:MAG: glucodextranase DOMON-like domain-containing protein [Bacillota bacterium]|nr:glucodextranase DOMON-like domain-containing protein [Bacillota bacterium]